MPADRADVLAGGRASRHEVRDAIIVDESAVGAVPEHLRDRVTTIAREAGLRLADIDHGAARTLTYLAPWSRLTVEASRLLAEWAVQDPRRGCGLMCLSTVAGSPASRATASPRVATLTRGDAPIKAGWFHADGYRDDDEGTVLEALRTPSATPAGAAIAGHGAEYCVRFGDAWLTPDSRASPPGDTVELDAIRAPAVLLNCCGSLRLGDSVVPQEFSLAHALHARGTLVVGCYRNRHWLPEADGVFAAALLRGLPLGVVANRLNLANARHGDGRPAFALLGDAAAAVVPAGAAFDEWPPGAPAASGLEELVGEALRLDRLMLTLDTWFPAATSLQRPRAQLTEIARLLALAVRAARADPLTAAELDVLAAAARERIVHTRGAVLGHMAAIVAGHWLDVGYGPVSRFPVAGERSCPRCGGQASRYAHAPYGPHLLGVDRIECDRCGTVADQIDEPAFDVGALRVSATAREAVVDVPPLAAGAVGCVLLRKASPRIVHEWPAAGGSARIALEHVDRRGRLVAAAIGVGDGGLTVAYGTFFAAF